MTDNIKALRDALAESAEVTQHPWHWHADPVKGDQLNRSRYEVVTMGRTITRTYYTDESAPKEAAIICTAVNAAPTLLAEVDRQAAEIERLRALIQQAPNYFHPGYDFDGKKLEWLMSAGLVTGEALKEQPK